MARLSRQWIVGAGGMRAVRKVKHGGYIKWAGHWFQHPDLSRFDGEFIFLEDFAGAGVTVSQCLWTMSRSGGPYAGQRICDLE